MPEDVSNAASPPERRGSRRFRTNRPIRFSDVRSDGKLRSGRVVDMSPTGLRIEAALPVTPGHAIEVEVEPEYGGGVFVLRGDVVRTESLDGSRYAMGVASHFEVRGSVSRRLAKPRTNEGALASVETAPTIPAPRRRPRFKRWLQILLLFFALAGVLNAANRSDVFATGNGGVFSSDPAAKPRLLESQIAQTGHSSRPAKKKANEEAWLNRVEAKYVRGEGKLEAFAADETLQTAVTVVNDPDFAAQIEFDVADASRFDSEAAQLASIDSELLIEIDLSQFMLHLRRDGAIVSSFPVGIGRDGATPLGRFQIARKLTNPDWYNRGETVPAGRVDNPLGASWMGWGGDSRSLGIGIHPTSAQDSIEQPLSRGCVRLKPDDAARLFRLVPTGTPVWVHE